MTTVRAASARRTGCAAIVVVVTAGAACTYDAERGTGTTRAPDAPMTETARPEPGPEEWWEALVVVAHLDPGRLDLAAAAERRLGDHGITGFTEGSLGYGVAVRAADAGRAREILRAADDLVARGLRVVEAR